MVNLTPEIAMAYLDIMEKIENDDEAFYSYFEDVWRGSLIDIDKDGIEELIVSYAKQSGPLQELLCDIWTIKNGESVRLLNRSLGAYVGASPSGNIMLVESMCETWLCFFSRFVPVRIQLILLSRHYSRYNSQYNMILTELRYLRMNFQAGPYGKYNESSIIVITKMFRMRVGLLRI